MIVFGSRGFYRQLVNIIIIVIIFSKIWNASDEKESKPKEEECVNMKQMLPLWKDNATKSEPKKDNCVCEARKRLMTSDCG